MERSTPLASGETIGELQRVLAYSKLDRVTSPGVRQMVFDSYVEAVQICIVDHIVTDCRDSADNKFLALALSGRADLIVSGDEDLLVLHPWRSIPILSPAGYLARVG